MAEIQTWGQVFQSMKDNGMAIPSLRERLLEPIPDAKNNMAECFKYLLTKAENKDFVYLKEYDKVAEWLEGNQGKCLLMYGRCGKGKTLLGRYVIPALYHKFYNKVITTMDMTYAARHIDEALRYSLLSLDDVGVEQKSLDYGNERDAFVEILDNAEKKGNMIIITSNLTGDELKQRYGERAYDRIVGNTTRVLFKGDSLRK